MDLPLIKQKLNPMTQQADKQPGKSIEEIIKDEAVKELNSLGIHGILSEKYFLKGYIAGRSSGLESLWISVESGNLPEIDREVLIYMPKREYNYKNNILIGWRDSTNWYSVMAGDEERLNVTHCMTLPQPLTSK